MKFDALEDILKAREAKGLAGWKKFEGLAEKLGGKHATDIAFTTCYPGQEGAQKYLGSASGNLHFLLGYVNPAFHVAPYHWQIVDPNLTDEEAKKKDHPANPRYWKESGLEMEDEGDLEEGKPHKYASKDKKASARRAAKKQEALQVRSGYGMYVALPSEGKVYSLTNGHVYDWSIIKESYFAYENDDVAEAMDEATGEDAPEEESEGLEESLEEEAMKSLDTTLRPFDNVYPLVKSLFPKPGSVIPLGEIKGLVTPTHVEFYDARNKPVEIQVFDRVYKSFDLLKGGDIHPSILLSFAENYLNVDVDSLQFMLHDENELPQFAKGLPTEGFDELADHYDRNVVIDTMDGGFTVRVVPRELD